MSKLRACKLFSISIVPLICIFILSELMHPVFPQRYNRQVYSISSTSSRPETLRRSRFSFFREFIAPIPGLLRDIFGYTTREDPIVEISNGALRGLIKESRNGEKYYAFLGVPYATPPERFQPPKKLEGRWPGVRNAIRYASPCFHVEIFVSGQVQGEEDCLYANVYSPKLNGNLPVMVYIHGGGFNSGSGDFYQGKYIMDENVVLVVFNYRLSALGFLDTEDENVRGNNALKDQVMLLNWVNENIRQFGGDPGSVTLFGESAGAAMTQYHMLSPKSRGLFHKVVALSGSALCPWAFNRHPLKRAKRLAQRVGCPSDDTKMMVNCLKTVPIQEFAKDYMDMTEPTMNPSDNYAPTIEKIITDDTFLTESAEDTLISGNFTSVPMILGLNSMEGLLFSGKIVADGAIKSRANELFKEWLPELLHYNPNRTSLTRLIKYLYFTTPTIDLFDNETFLNLTNLLSDGSFAHPIHKFARLSSQTNQAPVYTYFNSYQGRISVFDVFNKVKMSKSSNGMQNSFRQLNLGTEILSDLINYGLTNERPSSLGPSHGDSSFLLFNLRNVPGIGRMSMDYDMSRSFVAALADFASSSDPEIIFYNGLLWPRVEANQPMKYMGIELPGEVINEPANDRLEIWDEILSKEIANATM